MNLLLKNATLLESQNPFHKQQVDIEITDVTVPAPKPAQPMPGQPNQGQPANH